MKKLTQIVAALLVGLIALTGCGTEASRATHNVSIEADNFNITRRLVVINTVTDKPIMELIGNFSLTVDDMSQKLDIIVKEEDGTFKKHFLA